VPTVTGTATVGQNLTASTGVWTPTPDDYTYQWQTSGNCSTYANATGGGATTNTYTIVAADQGNCLRVQVTAVKTGYANNTQSSAATSTVATGTFAAGTPTMTPAPAVGAVITANTGTWTPTPAFTYRWQLSTDNVTFTNVPGSAGTATTYTPSAGDFTPTDKYLRVQVTGTLTGYTTTTQNSASAQIQAGTFTRNSAPTVSGTPTVGGTVSAVVTGAWSPTPTTYTHQWQTSPDGTTWTNATGSGAITATYSVVAADLGNHLRDVVTAHLANYNDDTQNTAATAAVIAGTMANGTAPTISGAATFGTTLNASLATWTPSATSVTYQWKVSTNGGSSWTAASGTGATTSAYTIASADVGNILRVEETGHLAGYNDATQNSSATATITPASFVTGTVPVASGSAVVNATLSATDGAWTPTPTSIAYQWQVSANGSTGWTSATGAGATTNSYTVASADYLQYLRVHETGSKPGYGDSPENSNVIGPIGLGTLTPLADPVASGTAAVGHDLTASLATWVQGADSVAYQWQVSDDGSTSWTSASGAGATTDTYTIAAADGTKFLRVQETATKATYNPNTRSSASRGPVVGVFVQGTAPVVTGTFIVGGALSASDGTWTPTPDAIAYQWQVSANGTTGWTNATGPGATTNAYTPNGADFDNYLRVEETASKSGYLADAYDSAATVQIGSGALVQGTAPSVTGTVVVGATLDASDATWTPSADSITYQWQVSDNGTTGWSNAAGSGATTAHYTIPASELTKFLRVEETGHATGYSDNAYDSAATAAVGAGTLATGTGPSVTGSAVVGQTLDASDGVWTPTQDSIAY
jgi:hypothetical protein